MSRRRRTGRVLLLLAFLGCALAIGLMMLKKYQDRQLAPTAPVAPQVEPATRRVITLFFATPDGSGLARESREVDACVDEAECIRAILVELVKGPVGDLELTLPPQTVVNGVSVKGGIATVDLSGSFVEGLPGGSSSEMMAAYSMVNSIASNLPDIVGVKFLIDGKESGTLKGNLDLRQPLTPDPKLEVQRSPSPPVPDAAQGAPGSAGPAREKK